jgi:GABA(A) receptor-associated protein
MINNFKSKYTLTQRKNESYNIMLKYPDRIPIVIQTENFNLKRVKFLVNRTLKLGQFIIVIRKHAKINPYEAIFISTFDGLGLCNNETINNIWYDYKDEDEFLYLCVNKENTFG